MSSEPPGGTDAGRPPPDQAITWVLLGLVAILVVSLTAIRTRHQPDSPRPGALAPLPPDGQAVLLDEPEMDDEYWPCTDCHEGEPVNARVRVLDDEHDEMTFDHGTTWCLDCHDAQEDALHLASGKHVDFDDTSRLCTQCHGEKLADWEAGVHGKRTGHWRGPKDYEPCIACHDPHDPTFAGVAPKPPPVRPSDIRWAGVAELQTGDSAPEEAGDEP